MLGIEYSLRKGLGLLPQKTVQLMDSARPEKRVADLRDLGLGLVLDTLQRLLHTQGVVSLPDFLDAHYRSEPNSIALLEVDDGIFRDLIWADALTVPELEGKMASGEISPQTLGRVAQEGPQQRFGKLQKAVADWHTVRDLG